MYIYPMTNKDHYYYYYYYHHHYILHLQVLHLSYTFSNLRMHCPSPDSITSKTSADGEIHCYIHAVSPVKIAASSERKYFSCTLQTKEQSVRAVCFFPEKQAELQTLEKVKSPVKLQNYKKNCNQGKQDIIISKYTKITPLQKNTIDFTPKEI